MALICWQINSFVTRAKDELKPFCWRFTVLNSMQNSFGTRAAKKRTALHVLMLIFLPHFSSPIGKPLERDNPLTPRLRAKPRKFVATTIKNMLPYALSSVLRCNLDRAEAISKEDTDLLRKNWNASAEESIIFTEEKNKRSSFSFFFLPLWLPAMENNARMRVGSKRKRKKP